MTTFDSRRFHDIQRMLTHYDPAKVPLNVTSSMNMLVHDLRFMCAAFRDLHLRAEAMATELEQAESPIPSRALESYREYFAHQPGEHHE